MKNGRMSLIEMQKRASEHGVDLKSFCKLAGMPWQSFYRKRRNEGIVRLSEYDALAKALNNITKRGATNEDHGPGADHRG